MTLREFAAVLATAYPKVSHYTASKEKGNYIVWTEYGGRKQAAGPLTVQKIQVDLYTRVELDPALKSVLMALEKAGVSTDAPATTYEEDTGYIHHIIECEIVSSAERME